MKVCPTKNITKTSDEKTSGGAK